MVSIMQNKKINPGKIIFLIFLVIIILDIV